MIGLGLLLMCVFCAATCYCVVVAGARAESGGDGQEFTTE